MTESPRVALYLRVSTVGQTVENQRQELERVAAARGWQIVEVFTDAGISGAKGRDKRPAFDKLLKGAVRRDFDLVAAWSVDRLGRSISDLIATLAELNGCGCALYLHQQALDTTTPSGKAMFQMLGVFAEFEREMIKARVIAGLARAKAAGVKLGHPQTPDRREKAKKARRLLAQGATPSEVAKRLAISRAAVYRARDEELDFLA